MNGPITETAAFGGKDTTVQFSASSYSANESDGSVTITVTRVGDPNSAPLVAYVTSDGTAKEGRDYVSSQGILTFAKGEMSKTFTVLIIDNGFVDSTRTGKSQSRERCCSVSRRFNRCGFDNQRQRCGKWPYESGRHPAIVRTVQLF